MAASANIENVSLLWYHNSTDDTVLPMLIDGKSQDCQIPTVQFDDLQSCIKYLESNPKRKFFLILPIPSTSVDTITSLHQYRQIDSIFMFSNLLSYDSKFVEDLLSKHAKIIGIYTDEKELIRAIKENIDLILKEELSFAFYNQHQKSTRELSTESSMFLWFLLFKDAILHMPRNDKNAKQHLVDYLKQHYRNNNKQLKLIEEFSSTYKAEDAIKWYTGQPFLYKNLNKALRTENIEQLYLYRFFIIDLCTALYDEYTYLKEYEPCITLYRGTSMNNDELERLKQNIGQLISTNGFLSSSQIKEVALAFVPSQRSSKKHRVLFEIECDLAVAQTIVLAPISQYSTIQDEKEVLFDIGAVFEITSITTEYTANMNEDGTFIVNDESILSTISMRATDEGGIIAKDYIEANQKLMHGRNSQVMFGILLADMGHYDQSIKYFERLVSIQDCLTDAPPDVVARAFNEIGTVLDLKGEYRKALECYKRAFYLTANVKDLTAEDIINLATPIANMAHVLKNLGDYEQSLELYLRALKSVETYLGMEHLQTARILENIGTIHLDCGNVNDSLEYFQRAYEIFKQLLPTDHLSIAQILSNIGVAYINLEEFNLAVKFLEQSLEMRKKLLPPDHVDIAISVLNIGDIFHETYCISKALDYYNEALRIFTNLFSNGHTSTAYCLQRLGMLHERIGNYDTALNYYEQALEMQQRLLPNEHPQILVTNTSIDHAIDLILCPPNKCFLNRNL